MVLTDVRLNFTDIELTDENTVIDDLGFGFIDARCRHCGANLHLNSNGVVTCLNACYLSTGAYRRMQSELAEIARKNAKTANDTQIAPKTNTPPLAGQETPLQPDVTAWPSDAPRPPFTVGGVYRFTDVWGRELEAHIITEQHARCGLIQRHVSEIPYDAVFVRWADVDAEAVADAKRFAREVINAERWS